MHHPLSLCRYNGNPVECDCTLRRIRSWLDNRLDSSTWNDVVCAAPQRLQGRALPFISEEELRCTDNRRSFEEYQVKAMEEDQGCRGYIWSDEGGMILPHRFPFFFPFILVLRSTPPPFLPFLHHLKRQIYHTPTRITCRQIT